MVKHREAYGKTHPVTIRLNSLELILSNHLVQSRIRWNDTATSQLLYILTRWSTCSRYNSHTNWAFKFALKLSQNQINGTH